MTPKIISSDIFKYRKEIDHDTLAKIIVKGGPVAVKEAMKTFGYDENENIAIPTIVIGGDGSIGGTKWTVLGKAPKKVTIKGIQLWPECEDEVHIALEVPEFDTFTFYNRCRNISGWIDSTELTWSVMRKNEKNKKVKVQPTNYEKTGIKGFSIRMGVMPVSVDTSNLTLAIFPLAKDEIKKKMGDKYNKVYCPQVALTMGDNNVKAMTIKLGLLEDETNQFGMGILPIIQDVRSDAQIGESFPTSLEIRKTMAHFLRGTQGFNNKIPRTLQDSLTEGPDKLVAIEAEFLWPEAHVEENDIPVEDIGT